MSAPARVAWISCVGEKGGAEVTMLQTFRVMDRSRFEPVVIQLRPGPLEKELTEMGVTTHVLRKHRMRDLLGVAGAVRSICRLTREHDLRLYHCNGFRAHAYGGLARCLTGVPNVVTVHSPEPPGLFTRALLSLPADQVIANCTATADHFTPRGWQSQVVWPGVNQARLAHHTSRDVLAARYGIPASRPWVAMCARLQRHKGQPHFLRAIAAAAKTHDIQGVLVGAALFGMEEDHAEELRQQAKDLGIADRVTFTGFIPDEDVAGFQAGAAVLLHTALLEDFGLVLAEANMLGVPVVAFAAVGPAAIIVPGETGWLAPVGDQDALDAALADALGDPEKRARFGAAARSRVRAMFTIEEHTRRTEVIYRRLTDRTAARRASR